MKIISKIVERASKETMSKVSAPTIVFFGDSVTQGCFEGFLISESSIDCVYEQNSAYHTHLKNILSYLYPKAAVTIVNAGIAGSNTASGLERIERDVLSHKPDLTVVCLGLNDCSSWGIEGIEKYENNLREIFERLLEIGSEVIFMTPNMLPTRVLYSLKELIWIRIAEKLARLQNEGVMDAYMDSARKIAAEYKIPVCDVYAKWKKMESYGTDTTLLLGQGLNHPTREMHHLFAYSILETMFSAD